MAAGYVDTNGVRLWYEELGRPDGAPVLLVMGGGASVVWWPAELLGGLVGAGYRVVQFDNRDVTYMRLPIKRHVTTSGAWCTQA